MHWLEDSEKAEKIDLNSHTGGQLNTWQIFVLGNPCKNNFVTKNKRYTNVESKTRVKIKAFSLQVIVRIGMLNFWVYIWGKIKQIYT